MSTLIIDASDLTAKFFARYCPKPYVAMCCTDVLAFLKAAKFDHIFVDLRMRGCDSVGVLCNNPHLVGSSRVHVVSAADVDKIGQMSMILKNAGLNVGKCAQKPLAKRSIQELLDDR